MLPRRILISLLAFVLASTACRAVTTPTPQPVPSEPPTATDTPIPALLTLEQLKNAEVKISGVSGTGVSQTVKLTDGIFQSGSDPASTDFASVVMGEQVAYGDLNGDGAQDAAIILAENYGGTGVFVSVAVMLNRGGQPVFAASAGIDDRPVTNSLSIQGGEILLDAIIHGPNDPGCCAAQPVTETFRLWGGNLTLTRYTSKIPNGAERVIEITSPAQGSQVSGPFTINGYVTIAPFENTLGYSVFVEGAADPALQSAIIVNAAEMGGPGDFALPLDLTNDGIKGNVRIQISDISPANGASLAVATLFITVQ